MTSFPKVIPANHSRSILTARPWLHTLAPSQTPALTQSRIIHSQPSFHIDKSLIISQLGYHLNKSFVISLSRQAKVHRVTVLYPHQVCSIYHLYQAVCVFKQDLQHYRYPNSRTCGNSKFSRTRGDQAAGINIINTKYSNTYVLLTQVFSLFPRSLQIVYPGVWVSDSLTCRHVQLPDRLFFMSTHTSAGNLLSLGPWD